MNQISMCHFSAQRGTLKLLIALCVPDVRSGRLRSLGRSSNLVLQRSDPLSLGWKSTNLDDRVSLRTTVSFCLHRRIPSSLTVVPSYGDHAYSHATAFLSFPHPQITAISMFRVNGCAFDSATDPNVLTTRFSLARIAPLRKPQVGLWVSTGEYLSPFLRIAFWLIF